MRNYDLEKVQIQRANYKLYTDFQLHPLTLWLFKGQLYFNNLFAVWSRITGRLCALIFSNTVSHTISK